MMCACSRTLFAAATMLTLSFNVSAFTPSVTECGRRRLSGAPTAPVPHCSTLQRSDSSAAVLHASANWFGQFLAKPTVSANSGSVEAQKLKKQLLSVVRGTQRGVSTSDEQRRNIDELIAALEPLNPTSESASSDSLSALWTLEWTTEKEILLLMEKGLPGQPSGPVQQRINVDARTLSNTMLFGKKSSFVVSSSIEPEESGTRVNFEFQDCKLTYQGFAVPLPPVGKGWFESVYLDDDFRVTRDVRGDVSVLIKSRH